MFFYLFQVLSTVLVCYVCHVLVCHGHIFNTSFLSKLASYKNSFWNPISYILREVTSYVELHSSQGENLLIEALSKVLVSSSSQEETVLI